MKVKKIDIWMGEIKDETGGLAAGWPRWWRPASISPL